MALLVQSSWLFFMIIIVEHKRTAITEFNLVVSTEKCLYDILVIETNMPVQLWPIKVNVLLTHNALLNY